jgi:hypothetical protein
MKQLITPKTTTTLALFSLLIIQACQHAPDFTAVRQQVLDLHDKTMAYSERSMNYHIQMDTLHFDHLKQIFPDLDTVAEKKQIAVLEKSLDATDNEMNDWMHAFDADLQNKSPKEALDYYTAEKLKIEQLVSRYEKVMTDADKYLQHVNPAKKVKH